MSNLSLLSKVRSYAACRHVIKKPQLELIMDVEVSVAATVLIAMYFPALWRHVQRKCTSLTQMCTITDLQPLCAINCAHYEIVF